MKIYTNTFDLSRPAPHRFWVPPYSDFKIGIKLVDAGREVEADFSVAAGTTELIADATKIDGFTIYTLNSTDTGFVEYTITVEGLLQKLKLVQIVSDSTVFDIDERGGDMSQYATKNWVESEISGFVDESELTAYATVDSLSDYVETAELTAYYTKSETSSAVELADAFSNVGGGAISAFDLSESPVWSKTMVENAVVNNICLPQTLVLNTDNSISVVDTGNTLSVSHNIGLQQIDDFPNSKKIIVGTKVKTLYGRVRSDNKELILPNSLTAFGGSNNGTFSANMYYTRIPDSVTSIGMLLAYSNTGWNHDKTVDFGNTRTTVPSIESVRNVGGNVKVYVPDALYDTWIAATTWSGMTSQIHRHSELEAPYLYSSKVSGGAATGATGTPAAVNAVKSVYETDWATLSATADTNTFYVVLPDPA